MGHGHLRATSGVRLVVTDHRFGTNAQPTHTFVSLIVTAIVTDSIWFRRLRTVNRMNDCDRSLAARITGNQQGGSG